ncbi:aldehyde dehydrogenase family protein [Streptomyces sp. NPDC098085]|uniref:aldehyde dehydrogenase family protein n=1 Tax=Streptomyces sp. NPDC098085 TaxID=3366094 RepID=UPI00382CE08F
MSKSPEIVRSRWSSKDDAHRFGVVNPATGRLLAQVQSAGPTEVDLAVRAAAEGQRSWARRTPAERGAALRRAAEAIQAHAQELAELESREMGKPVSQALNFDLRTAVGLFDLFGGLLHAVTGDARDSGPILDVTGHYPFGVVAGIVPFNWPPIHTAGKAAPALAMGNAMVLKPGEQAPLTVMRIVEIVSAVLPDDVLHVVPGEAETGAALTRHQLIRKISFTGAPTTGTAVAKAAADNLVPTVLELGGKNPLIVFPDADLDAAARGIVEGGFFNQGEACTAASRVLVHRDVRDALADRVSRAVAGLVVGDGADRRTHVGPLVTQAQQQRVLEYLRVGEQEGARVAARAQLPYVPELADGFFVPPTLFVDVTPDMRIAQEEIFGPVVSMITFDDEEEAIVVANGTEFGLVAGIYTRDYQRGVRVGRRIEAGVVFVNHYHRGGVGVPFGGTKHSGYGREHTLETLREWTYTKTLRLPFGEGSVPEWDAVSDVFDDATGTD